jgi:hypothetical protein
MRWTRLRFATLAVAAVIVVVVLGAVGSFVRPPGGAAPTSPGSPAAFCEAFADGGPMETLGNAIFAARRGDDWTSPARDGITGLLALAERVSGYEREDLLVLARAVAAARGAADPAFDLYYAHVTFLEKYGEGCGLDLGL